jgi:hypothetical protein
MITTGMGLRFGLGKLELTRLLVLNALGGGTAVGLVVFFWPVPIIRTARFFDQFYSLSDRTSTAVELLRADPINAMTKHVWHANAMPRGSLSQLQIEDAVAHGTGISPRTGFFLLYQAAPVAYRSSGCQHCPGEFLWAALFSASQPAAGSYVRLSSKRLFPGGASSGCQR